MTREAAPLLVAVLALAACTGSARTDGPGALPPLRPRPTPVTTGNPPVRVTSCKDEGDGHVTVRALLVAPRRTKRDWVVQFQVSSGGVLIEEAYAEPRDVPAGSEPVPIVGSGTLYVTGGGSFTCEWLSANPLSRRPATPSK